MIPAFILTIILAYNAIIYPYSFHGTLGDGGWPTVIRKDG